MLSERDIQVDHRLHEALVPLVRRHGPQPLEWLTARARRDLRDARIDPEALIQVIEYSTMLVPRPDGLVCWLGDALDGIVLTHRARAALSDRADLWCGLSAQPLLNLAAYGGIPLAEGGEVTRMELGPEVLVGPQGWLPDVPRFGLLALVWKDGRLSVRPVDDADLPGAEECQRVRALIADHYRRERWWSGHDDLESRPAELVRALTLARLEDPDLLSTAFPPLDELLYSALERDVDEHHWRDVAAVRQTQSMSFHLEGVPQALYLELSARARLYGMSLDQFAIAVLGHLAWRTPFAEDCEPYDYWLPESESDSEPPLDLPED